MRTLRSMLHSMQRILSVARQHVALGVLSAALGLLGATGPGCGTDAPTDVQEMVEHDLYGPQDYFYDPGANVEPVPEDVQEWIAADLYGCPDACSCGVDCTEPSDEVVPPDDVNPDQPQVLYGPPPNDVAEEQVPDVTADCQTGAYYGPPPCASDAECQAAHDANWYCDTTNLFPDGCGGTVPYPQCKPKP